MATLQEKKAVLREKQSEMEAKLEAASEELKERREQERLLQSQSVRLDLTNHVCTESQDVQNWRIWEYFKLIFIKYSTLRKQWFYMYNTHVGT